MKLFFILGNQLFPPKYLDRFKNDHLFFMSEDYELCTYEKHHKLKILLFLSAMRSHADNLKKNKFKIEYTKIDSGDFKKDYLEKIKKIIKSKKIKEITSFEIEDKFFEKKVQNFVKKNDFSTEAIDFRFRKRPKMIPGSKSKIKKKNCFLNKKHTKAICSSKTTILTLH